MKTIFRRQNWGWLGCTCLLAATAAAQAPCAAEGPATATTPSLASELEAIRQEYQLPAVAGGIFTAEGLQHQAAVGVRKLGSDVPVTDHDLWHLGSCTKAMTATLLATLVQQGKLSWDSTLAELFPEVAEEMDASFRQITLVHLLTHRSGLPANGPWWELGDGKSPTQQRHELLRQMCQQPLAHPPGSHYEYSNVGYALAGLMAEQVLEQSWEEALQQRVFEPLDMPAGQVGFGVPGPRGELDQPWGHRTGSDQQLVPRQHDNAPSLGPAGIVHASLDAWAKFLAAHLQRPPRLLKPELWEQLHTPPAEGNYALGWVVVERPWAGQALNHTGSNTLNYCVCWLAPSHGWGVMAVTNSGQKDANQALDDVAKVLIRRAAAAHEN